MPAFAKDPVRVDIPEARILAERLYTAHQFRAARDVASTLLQRDPKDITALLILSQAERALGHTKPAVSAGKRAWAAALNPMQKYGSAIVTAQALSAGGMRTRAQVWLRRATQKAPNAALRQRAIRDFQYVQSRNPFRTDIHFSVQPSSNINNGSKSDSLVIGGLAFALNGDARALSGVEISYGFSTTYKKQTSADHKWYLGFKLDARNYVLSAAAKRLAPGQRASDYAYVSTELSFGSTKILDQGRGALDFNLAVGRNWYGGAVLGDFARISVSRMFSQTASTQSRYKVSVTRQLRKDNALRSSTQVAVAGHWAKAFNNGSVLRWNVGAQTTSSALASVAHKGFSAGASLSPKKDLFGARVTYSLNLVARRDDLPTFGVLRSDNKVSAGVSLFFSKADYYGFAPNLSFVATRNQSNIALYDTVNYGLSLGLRSTF